MSGADDVAGALARIDQLMQAGQMEAAEGTSRELVERAPHDVNGWVRLGLVTAALKNYRAAEEAYRNVIALQPNDPRVWNELSVAVNKQGRGAEAAELAQRAIQLDPSNALYWATLGNALSTDHRWAECAAALQQSLTINSRDAAVWNNFGNAQLKLQRMEAAEAAFQRSLALAPGNLGATSNYAFLLCQVGRRKEAAQRVEAALASDPQQPRAWYVIGELWQMMAEWDLAEAAYRWSLTLAPHDRESQYQLARTLRSKRQFTAAEATLREHLSRYPDHADALALLGEVLSGQGRASEGMPFYRQALAITPDENRHGRLLVGMQYDEGSTPEQLLAEHRQFDALYARRLAPARSAKAARSAEKLRIGFVSADFGRHPTAYLVLPALEHLDRAACSMVCYSDRAQEDEYTARFRAAAAQWRVIYGQTDDDVAAQIRRDNIDVLVDLMGHFGKRMMVFARRPAPLQLSWLGYVGTTGLTAMDGLIADRFHVRQGEEPWYSETVLRMPHDYICYGPPADAPPVDPLPAAANGYVTFGCFNKSEKYSLPLMEAWATILGRVRTARLLLKAGGFDDGRVKTYWYDWFTKRGIATERIALEGTTKPTELLAWYNRVDLGLDTQPYSGGLTTCEALWMGVPVITLPGRTFAGRHSTSHMTNAGYGQFVVADWADYIELAVQWAERIEELARMRAQMRSQVALSPLCNAPQFARDLLKLLQDAWRVLVAEKLA